MIALIVIVTVVFLISIFYSRNIDPILRDAAEYKLRLEMTSLINEASLQAVNSGRASLVTISKDASGSITAVETNAAEINILEKKIIKSVQDALIKAERIEAKVPLGTILGLSILSGIGPSIRIYALPLASSAGQYHSSFMSAGINQTCLKQYLKIEVKAKAVLGGGSRDITAACDVLIGETIIIGKIPDVYLNSGANGLNLVP